ncbi:hypothetical protein MKK75_03695, partial [Methylobacterium sp. J-030]|nr:hypothetical protein [Methylobacterium sp. J-030]
MQLLIPCSVANSIPLRLMPRALDTTGLPNVLAVILWPWIDAIEAVRPGMADPLQKTAEKSVRDLRHLIIVTAPLET